MYSILLRLTLRQSPSLGLGDVVFSVPLRRQKLHQHSSEPNTFFSVLGIDFFSPPVLFSWLQWVFTSTLRVTVFVYQKLRLLFLRYRSGESQQAIAASPLARAAVPSPKFCTIRRLSQYSPNLLCERPVWFMEEKLVTVLRLSVFAAPVASPFLTNHLS